MGRPGETGDTFFLQSMYLLPRFMYLIFMYVSHIHTYVFNVVTFLKLLSLVCSLFGVTTHCLWHSFFCQMPFLFYPGLGLGAES